MATYDKCKDALVKLRDSFVASKSVAERQALLNTAISDPDLKDCKALQRQVAWAFENIDWKLVKKQKKRSGFFSIFKD